LTTLINSTFETGQENAAAAKRSRRKFILMLADGWTYWYWARYQGGAAAQIATQWILRARAL